MRANFLQMEQHLSSLDNKPKCTEAYLGEDTVKTHPKWVISLQGLIADPSSNADLKSC